MLDQWNDIDAIKNRLTTEGRVNFVVTEGEYIVSPEILVESVRATLQDAFEMDLAVSYIELPDETIQLDVHRES